MTSSQLPNQVDMVPVLIPRRGEVIAWVLSVLGWGSWLILQAQGQSVQIGLKIFTVLLTLSAIMITIGNLVDRHTRLRLNPDGIYFSNGLRKIYMPWHEIQHVEVIPSNWGKKVRVVGESAHFHFRTFAEVQLNNQTRGKMGFEKGEQILQHILAQADLLKTNVTNRGYTAYTKE